MLLAMAKKSKFIRIRSDDELKAAIAAAAAKSDRQEADQARYILRVALGLLEPEGDHVYETRLKTRGDPQKLKGGGRETKSYQDRGGRASP